MVLDPLSMIIGIVIGAITWHPIGEFSKRWVDEILRKPK